MTSLYGACVTSRDVEDAIVTTVATWAAHYVALRRTATGLDIPMLRVATTSLPPVDDPGLPDLLPACVVRVPGTVGTPREHGGGSVSAAWSAAAAAVIAHQDYDAAKAIAQEYEAVLRMLLSQQAALGGVATGTTWVGSEVVPLEWDTQWQAYLASTEWEIHVQSVHDRFGGPLTPPADPAAPLEAATVLTTHPTITAVPLTEEV